MDANIQHLVNERIRNIEEREREAIRIVEEREKNTVKKVAVQLNEKDEKITEMQNVRTLIFAPQLYVDF